MMTRFLAATLLFLSVPLLALADEPAEPPSADHPIIDQLLRRIDQLEKRVAELESRPAPPRAIVPPTYTAPIPPRAVPRNPIYPPTPAVPRTVVPRALPDQDVPPNWQRFEFNGQWFYIVPVEQLERRISKQEK